MSFDIVAVGHIINETIVYPGQETRTVLGSPPAYSMTVAARLGVRAGVFTRIGTDYPRDLLRPFQDAGVDMQGVICRGNVSTKNKLVYAENGTKQIHYMTKAPPIELGDLPQDYRNARLFYACPMDFDMSVETVQGFGNLGGLVAMDLGGFGGAHSPPGGEPQMSKNPDSVRALIAAGDIVKASDEDCQRLTGDEHLDLELFAREWLDWGATIAVVTLGSAGTVVVTPQGKWDVPALPGSPVDATGGGDSYMGGFLARYLQTRDPWEAGLYGAATALLVIEGTGGVLANRMPTEAMVEQRLKQTRDQLNL